MMLELASEIVQPNPGMNVAFLPCACAILDLNIIGVSKSQRAHTIPSPVFTSSNLDSPNTVV